MKDIRDILDRVLTSRSAKLRQIAAEAGIDPSQISRFNKTGAGLSEEAGRRLGKALAKFNPEPQLNIPEAHIAALAHSLKRRELTVFVGAGLSHLAAARDGSGGRLPLWPQLAAGLAEELGQQPEKGRDPLHAIDRLAAACGENEVRGAVCRVVDERGYLPSAAHLVLARLPWLNVVTTNYDGLLSQVVQPVHRFPLVQEGDFQRRETKPESKTDRRVLNLVHLHGDLQHPHTLFSRDYRRWAQMHPQAHRFLEDVVSPPHCVLFLGYGLGDPHVRDLIDMVRELTKAENRLYAWMWNIDTIERDLLARDNIIADSIDHEEGWAQALSLLEDRLDADESGAAACPEPPASPAAKASERTNYAVTVTSILERVNLTQYYIGEAQTGADITLRDLYVAPDVQPVHEAPAGKKGGRKAGRKAGAGTLMNAPGMDEDVRAECTGISGWIGRHRHLVLLGEPGQGKSTLLRRLVMDGLEAWLAAPPEQPQRLPVLIQLSHWERDCPAGQSLRDYAVDLMVATYGLPREAYLKWMEAGVLWLLDGVDEVRDDERRATLRAGLAGLAEGRDAVIVTSRPAGYFDEPLGKPWFEVRLAPLSEAQSLEMLRKIFAIFQRLEGLLVPADAVFCQLGRETSLARLRRNALQLTMIAVFFRSRRELPRDRWEFYTFAAEYLMRTREARRSEAGPGVKAGARFPAHDLAPGEVHAFFQSLAARMMQEEKVALYRDELGRFARDYFASCGRREAGLEAAVQDILRAAQGLNGVFVERGRDLYGFVHLTYQEFYAASWLFERQAEAEKLATTHGLRDDWAVVWDLYVLSLKTNDLRIRQLHEAQPGADGLLRRLRWLGLGPVAWAGVCPDGKVLAWAAGALRDIQSETGQSVLRVLANWERTYPEEIRQSLTGLLCTGENKTRHTAAQALGEQAEGRELLTALLCLLCGGDAVARGFAEYALAIPARAGQPVVAGELRRLSADERARPEARAAAVRALGGAVAAPVLWPVPGRVVRHVPLAPGVDLHFLHVPEADAPFWLLQHQVTQEQWLALMPGGNPSQFQGTHLPVESVDWQQCQDFCSALGRHPALRTAFGPGWQPGLPLEKDWETACRAGRKGEFNTGPGGDGKSLGSHQANFDGNYPAGDAEQGVCRQRTVAVGTFPPNDWGFHDLHGNVWEWCDDWYEKGRLRVVRGGGFGNGAGGCAAGGRYGALPGVRDRGQGLRVSLRSIQH